MKALLFFLFAAIITYPQGKGNLVLIGGGEKPDHILQKIIDLAGGTDAKILVIPNASSDPFESGSNSVEGFRKLGCTGADYLFCNREEANSDSMVGRLKGAKGIYFAGGDQSRLTGDLLGTKLLEEIRKILENGGVISGTSAGAAVMSKIMITGNELINNDGENAFIDIKKGNIETTEGFGFIKSAIIDQHFIKRKRLNRLISLILENPELIGIGIDESTAIVVDGNLNVEVLGEGQVIVFDATECKDIKLDENGNLGAENVNMHVLISGDKFRLNKKHELHN